MIRISTSLHDEKNQSSKTSDALINQLKTDKVDILCYQRTSIQGTDQLTTIRTMAEDLGMNYTYSNITAKQKSNSEEQKSQTALSILTAKNTWVLNSGSLSINSGDNSKDQPRVQFGLIRHNGNSILIVNVHFCSGDTNYKKQLTAHLELPLFKEQYGAIVFHSNMNEAMSENDLKKSFDKIGLKYHRVIDTNEPYRIFSLLTAKDEPLATITIQKNGSSEFAEFELQRTPKDKRQKRYSPLSFQERWLGSRDSSRAFA